MRETLNARKFWLAKKMVETCPKCGELTVYLSSDRKRKLCIKCKHEEKVNENCGKGELKKRVIRLIIELAQCEDSISQVLDSYIRGAESILDEAMQDLIASVHDSCWFHNEAGCDAPDWKVYHNQSEDCPLRKIEKWFGEVKRNE